MISLRAVWTVWLRHYAVFRKNLAYGLTTTFVEPVLYLGSFGFGLGSVIGNLEVSGQSVSYRAFVLAGLLGQAVLFTSFFDGAYGGFVRMYYQRIFQAIAVTPITLSEVLWGELLWCASRGVLSASVILLIGIAVGDFSPGGCLLLLPVLFLASFLFGAFGMWVASISRTIESISYPQYLIVFPMFLFCGVYFPLSNLPAWGQTVAAFLPLTSMLSISRSLLLGFQSEGWSLLVLVAWAAVLIPLARKRMKLRLVA